MATTDQFKRDYKALIQQPAEELVSIIKTADNAFQKKNEENSKLKQEIAKLGHKYQRLEAETKRLPKIYIIRLTEMDGSEHEYMFTNKQQFIDEYYEYAIQGLYIIRLYVYNQQTCEKKDIRSQVDLINA